MLGDKNAVATIAVKDMAAAQKFYEGTLGLTKADIGEDPGGVMYKSGNSMVFVYQSEFAGTNKATTVSWGVGENIEKAVEELKAKGVTFEHYDMPNVTREGDIHIIAAANLKSAWFKDPDGNILNIVNKM
jgi:catechol 2,3-dioxygenase-like lactoylglutathione lyase family enzyme